MSRPVLCVTCGLIRRGDRILLARRADSGLWELPGGKVEPGEGLAQCLARELDEELGVRVAVGEVLALVEHRGPGPSLDLHCLDCAIIAGEPAPREHRELAWVPAPQAMELDLCPADRTLLARLADRDPGSP